MSNIDIHKKYYLEASIYDANITNKKINCAINFLCAASFICTFVFFISWAISAAHIHLVLPNTNFLSSIFYFVNSNIWQQIFLDINNYSSFFFFATNTQHVIMLSMVYISIYTFLINFCISFAYLAVSLYYEKRHHKTFAIWSFFPLLNFVLSPFFLLFLLFLKMNKQMQEGKVKSQKILDFLEKMNKYREDFSPKVVDKYEILDLDNGKSKRLITRLKNIVDKKYHQD